MRGWLIEIREKLGVSQYKAAEMCGISQSYISAIELGTRDASVKTAKKIGKAYGFNWERFFEDEDTPDNTEEI